MRLRNVKGSREAIVDSLYTINEPAFMKGKWAEHFGNNHPIHIEVGMGKGRFITDLARQNPDINYVGIEKYSSVLIRAIEKLEQLNSNSEMPVKNLIFIRMNAENLCDVFFARYDQILIPDGQVEFKTDNRDLFDFSLEQIPLAGWKLSACTFDLHHDDVMNQGNIMTEYEERFSSMGNPIHKLIAIR